MTDTAHQTPEQFAGLEGDIEMTRRRDNKIIAAYMGVLLALLLALHFAHHTPAAHATAPISAPSSDAPPRPMYYAQGGFNYWGYLFNCGEGYGTPLCPPASYPLFNDCMDNAGYDDWSTDICESVLPGGQYSALNADGNWVRTPIRHLPASFLHR
jgi:hypothetical protein